MLPFLYLIKSQALLEGLYFNTRAGKVVWIYWDKVKSQVSEQFVWPFSLIFFFFNFKDAVKELHEAPFHMNTKLILIRKVSLSQNLLFFPTSHSEAGLALEKQKLVENCQKGKATESEVWKEHKSINWRFVLVSFGY